jgi:hypothetical protein
MKKNFRKTPDFITNKIKALNSDNIIIATIIKGNKNEIEDLKFENLNLQLNNTEISFNKQFIPKSTIGFVSRKNIDGYKIVYKDRDKINKSFYAGERPYYGDWSKGSFSHYLTREVYPSDDIPPRELSIIIELLDETVDDFKIKVSVDIVLNRNDENFYEELFFAINLLQENVYSVNVFSSESTSAEYLSTLLLDWEVFTPGLSSIDLE